MIYNFFFYLCLVLALSAQSTLSFETTLGLGSTIPSNSLTKEHNGLELSSGLFGMFQIGLEYTHPLLPVSIHSGFVAWAKPFKETYQSVNINNTLYRIEDKINNGNNGMYLGINFKDLFSLEGFNLNINSFIAFSSKYALVRSYFYNNTDFEDHEFIEKEEDYLKSSDYSKIVDYSLIWEYEFSFNSEEDIKFLI